MWRLRHYVCSPLFTLILVLSVQWDCMPSFQHRAVETVKYIFWLLLSCQSICLPSRYGVFLSRPTIFLHFLGFSFSLSCFEGTICYTLLHLTYVIFLISVQKITWNLVHNPLKLYVICKVSLWNILSWSKFQKKNNKSQ